MIISFPSIGMRGRAYGSSIREHSCCLQQKEAAQTLWESGPAPAAQGLALTLLSGPRSPGSKAAPPLTGCAPSSSVPQLPHLEHLEHLSPVSWRGCDHYRDRVPWEFCTVGLWWLILFLCTSLSALWQKPGNVDSGCMLVLQPCFLPSGCSKGAQPVCKTLMFHKLHQDMSVPK